MAKFFNKKGNRRGYENPYTTNYDCFHIRDFKEGDSVLVYNKGEKIRGVVTKIDPQRWHVHYKTSTSDDNYTHLNYILMLSDFSRGWINS
jgi:hypothetical protein